jgi:hypothetical protein
MPLKNCVFTAAHPIIARSEKYSENGKSRRNAAYAENLKNCKGFSEMI